MVLSVAAEVTPLIFGKVGEVEGITSSDGDAEPDAPEPDAAEPDDPPEGVALLGADPGLAPEACELFRADESAAAPLLPVPLPSLPGFGSDFLRTTVSG